MPNRLNDCISCHVRFVLYGQYVRSRSTNVQSGNMKPTYVTHVRASCSQYSIQIRTHANYVLMIPDSYAKDVYFRRLCLSFSEYRSVRRSMNPYLCCH